MKMGKLEGKIALVTGGSSGIGLATAKRFVSEGAFVFITGRREADLAAAVKEIGNNVAGVQSDTANLGDLDRLFARMKQEKGKLDIVFANAGTARYARLGEITEELYDTIFDINVKGVLFTVQKALPLLSDGASVILNASIVGSKGLASNSVYSATKAAVRSFARTWTTDLKDRRIRVNAISPGSIDTPASVSCSPLRRSDTSGAKCFPASFRSGGSESPTRSRRPLSSSPPTTAVTLPVSSSSWTAASPRSREWAASRKLTAGGRGHAPA
jgi:NAD(P)-dependent dehydrogenase (short-subunit alcohol dehydrogenase family)